MLQMTMNKYVLKFCYFFNSVVNNVSVRSEFYMFRKRAAGKTESKGRKYIDESWSTGDLKDGKDWGIENSVFCSFQRRLINVERFAGSYFWKYTTTVVLANSCHAPTCERRSALVHCTKNWIYTNLLGVNMVKKVQTRGKLKAKMVNTAFACQVKWGCKF